MVSYESDFEFIDAKVHIYASQNNAIIGSGNGLSPIRHQTFIWTNAVLLLTGPLWTNFSAI